MLMGIRASSGRSGIRGFCAPPAGREIKGFLMGIRAKQRANSDQINAFKFKRSETMH